MQEKIVGLGLLLILMGFALVFAGSLFPDTNVVDKKHIESKSAFVLFVGPFPIGFGNDPGLVKILMLTGFALLALLVFMKLS